MEGVIGSLKRRLSPRPPTKWEAKGRQREIFKQIVSQRIELELSEHFAGVAKVERDKLFAKVDK